MSKTQYQDFCPSAWVTSHLHWRAHIYVDLFRFTSSNNTHCIFIYHLLICVSLNLCHMDRSALSHNAFTLHNKWLQIRWYIVYFWPNSNAPCSNVLALTRPLLYPAGEFWVLEASPWVKTQILLWINLDRHQLKSWCKSNLIHTGRLGLGRESGFGGCCYCHTCPFPGPICSLHPCCLAFRSPLPCHYLLPPFYSPLAPLQAYLL